MAVELGQEAHADETLIERVHHRDPDSLAALYDRHSAAAYSLALSIVGEHRSAEDVTQEAFLSLWRTSATFDPGRGSARSWILATVRNRAIDALRRGERAPATNHDDEVAIEELPCRARTDGEVIRGEARAALFASIRGLPEAQSQALWLAYFEGLSHVEIARRMRVPEGTAKGRLRLGLEKLRSVHDGSLNVS